MLTSNVCTYGLESFQGQKCSRLRRRQQREQSYLPVTGRRRMLIVSPTSIVMPSSPNSSGPSYVCREEK